MRQSLLRLEPLAFALFVLVWLSPIWMLDYFVTGDGPCHLYNSRIIWDWLSSNNRDFIQPFYFLNMEFEPNWMFNLITVPVTGAFGPIVAEKTFFLLYGVLFCYGFRFLVTQINPNAKFLSYIAALFCYHGLLMSGFLNNSISLALWFWVVGWWWKTRADNRPLTLLATTILTLCLYFSHPMGFVYACLMVACMLVGELFFEKKQLGWKAAWAGFWNRAWYALLCVFPALLLFAAFLLRHNWSKEPSKVDRAKLWNDIAHLSPLQTVSTQEREWAVALSVGIGLLFVFALAQRLYRRYWTLTDGVTVLLFVVLYTTFFPLQSMSGGLEVSFRMVMIPFFGVLLFCGSITFPRWVRLGSGLFAVTVAAGLLWLRMPVHRAAAAYVEEIRSCAPYLHDRSSLITLNYDWAGVDTNRQPISNRAWLFTHVDCYLGTDKTMAISDNYETHFSYFPVHSHWQTDMYQNTDIDGINFDHRPPRADLLNYHRRTGQYLDYVLMLCYSASHEAHPYTQEILTQLQTGYDKVYTSPHGRAVLYKMKPSAYK